VHRRSPALWWWLVTACVLLLVAVGVALLVWLEVSRETRTTSYRVLGDLGSIQLNVGAADVQITGGASVVEVQRIDRFAFGHDVREQRSASGGTFSIRSRCPAQVVRPCRIAYRIAVPDNVPIQIKTTSGDVRLAGVRASVQVSTSSGAISATDFCGFSLRAISDSGGVDTVADCSSEDLELRSRSGSVRATVPSGRYHVDAESDSGASSVHGVTNDDDAPYQVQALSTSGDVEVVGT
jgi:Putative adhesin